MRSHTITALIFLGLTEVPFLQVLTFLLSICISSISRNLIIIVFTLVDSHLKTPMYFLPPEFLFSGNIIYTFLYSKILVEYIVTGDRTISSAACSVQLFLGDLFAVTECFLLAAMSYDRCVTICKPLHYVTMTSSKVCQATVIWFWTIGFFIIFPPLNLIVNLEFCDSNVIYHLGCDVPPILEMSLSDTWLIKQMVIYCAGLIFMFTLVCDMFSYIYIIKTILKLSSLQQRKKAFSTCSSHMIAVSIPYVSCIFIYLNTSVKENVEINKSVSLLISFLSPVLNPFIYTLRNKQVK